MVVEWPFRENGAERIYSALDRVGFCDFKDVFKVIYRSKWAVGSRNLIEQTPYNVPPPPAPKKRRQKTRQKTPKPSIDTSLGDVFSSYIVIFPATHFPLLSEWLTKPRNK